MTQPHEPTDAASSSPEASGESGRRERASSDFRSSMSGLDHSSIMGVELMSAIVVWTGIGWLLDEWLGTGPVLMIVGALIGNFAGLYLIWLRSGRMEEAERRAGAARRAAAERPRVISSPVAAVVDAVVAGRTGVPTAVHTHGIDPRKPGEQGGPPEPVERNESDGDADAPGGRLLER